MKSTLLFTLLATTSTAHAIEFDVGPLLRGEPTTVSVTDGVPGHVIEIVRSSRPPVANATCPPVLGGACVDLVAPVRVASVEVSAQGLADHVVQVPAGLRPQHVWFQAIDRTTGGKSPVVHSRVLNVCSGTLRTDVPAHNAVLADCGRLEGDLFWSPLNGVMPELPWLQEIEWLLLIRPGALAQEVSGLPRLRSANIVYVLDAPNLRRITGFGELRELEHVSLENIGELSRNDLLTAQVEPFSLSLERLPWLSSLTQLGPLPPLDDLGLRDIPLLVDLTGMHPAGVESFGLSLHDLPALQSLRGVSPPTGYLSLYTLNTAELSDLSGLEGAVSAGLSVRNAPRITDFDVLSGLTTLSGLHLRDMESLTTIEHLSGAIGPDTSSVWLDGLPELTSLAALDGLVSVEDLHLVDLPRVESLSPLAGLVGALPDFELSGLTSLTSLDGLQGLVEIRHLDTSGAAITSLDGLRGLVRADELIVSGSALTSLDGLQGLVEIGYLLEISDNPITSLDGLQGLVQVDDLIVSGNPLLTDVSALNGLEIAETVVVRDNTALCEDNMLLAMYGADITYGLDMGNNGICVYP
jgi:hypothetical protein